MRRCLVVGLVIAALALASGCGDDENEEGGSGTGSTTSVPEGGSGTGLAASVPGIYECGLEGGPAREVWKLDTDQSMTVAPKDDENAPGEEGTWSIQDGQVIVNFAGANNDPFDVDGDRLVFAGPKDGEATWVCTRTVKF